MFLVVPSSRVSGWIQSSWMRRVFSTMPSFAAAIEVEKNRLHSQSVNRMPFRASSWRRRLATRAGSSLKTTYSYACRCNCLMKAASSSASVW